MPAPLLLEFTYDHALGNFACRLPNGAIFRFERNEVSGKLKANLELYRRAFVEKPTPRAQQQGMTKAEARDAAAEAVRNGTVRRYEKNGGEILELEDLELDLEGIV